MLTTLKISPTKAILLCINSMIGAGLFINTRPLTQIAGPFGFVGYVFGVIMLLPLILCIAELARMHPVAGGLYVYSSHYLGRAAGFISCWAYFVGKTTSAALLTHKFVEFFQQRIACLAGTSTLLLDCTIITLVVALNSGGLSVGGSIQYVFTALKAIPLLFAFGIGFLYLDPAGFASDMVFMDVLSTLSVAVFPLLGFEIICAIGNQVSDGQRNIKRVILASFCIVATVNILFQTVCYGVLGNGLTAISEPVLALGLTVFGPGILISLINGFVFAAIIGACFSIFTSNCWNLHTIARYGHLPLAQWLTKVNAHNVPWVSLLIEAALGCAILFVTVDQRPLQNMAVFAQVIAYFASAAACLYAVYKGAIQKIGWYIPLAALASCTYIIAQCLDKIIASGASVPFLGIFLSGVILAAIKR